MRKPATGEPYAGKPPVRFGGRGGLKPSLPLSGVFVVMAFDNSDTFQKLSAYPLSSRP